MQGLILIPSLRDLERAYQRLSFETVRAEKLVLYAQWTRFDPRLAELCVTCLAKNWRELDPMALRKLARVQAWPATLGVLLEFCAFLIERSDRGLFAKWVRIATHELNKGNNEQYFFGLREFAGASMLDDAAYSLQEYRKWGYFSQEVLIPKTQAGSRSVETRMEILKNLLSKSLHVRTMDYWNAVGRCISRRQAERDMRASGLLRARGYTKGRIYSGISRKRSPG